MSERPLPARTPSPMLRDVARQQLALGALVALAGATTLVLGSWTSGAALLLAGAGFMAFAGLVRLSGDAIPLVNTAFNALFQGRVAEAERLLDQVEGRYQLGYIRRIVDMQRASIALRRGDLDVALARVEAALARPPGLLTRAQEATHLATARATRALLRASLGDHEGARADAAAVRRLSFAPAEAQARAEVAEAIALERSGDRAALAAHLTAKRALLLDSTTPRERAVVRAYQRMLAAPKTTVYRRGATREAVEAPGAVSSDPPEPTVADWISRVAPAAAPFARAARAPSPAGAAPAAEVVEPGLVRVAEARLASPQGPASAPSRFKVAAVWVLLVALFAGLWEVFRAEPGDVDVVMSNAPDLAWVVIPLVVIALSAAYVVSVVRGAGHDRRLAAALGALARGDARAVAEIEAIAGRAPSHAGAEANLHLARLAVRRADFDEAMRRCDQGIALVSTRASGRGTATPMLLPDLVAERAFVLAATDCHSRASAELAMLVKAFPAYPFLARAELRVGLVQRVRRGDLAGAAQLVAGATDDMPLSLRDETLGDLVRATVHPEAASAGEVQRLTEELRLDAELRAWIDAVAPQVRRAFEAPPVTGSEEAEREAAAEAEALAAEAAPQVARA